MMRIYTSPKVPTITDQDRQIKKYQYIMIEFAQIVSILFLFLNKIF